MISFPGGGGDDLLKDIYFDFSSRDQHIYETVSLKQESTFSNEVMKELKHKSCVDLFYADPNDSDWM